jgi:hypothetical protein
VYASEPLFEGVCGLDEPQAETQAELLTRNPRQNRRIWLDFVVSEDDGKPSGGVFSPVGIHYDSLLDIENRYSNNTILIWTQILGSGVLD